MIKTIYHYDNDGFVTATGEFDTEIYEVVPPKSTLVEMPTEGEHQKAKFDPETETWALLPDYQGMTFIDTDGVLHTIDELGVEPEPDWVPYVPESSDGEDELEEVKQRLSEIEDALLTLMFGGVA